MYIRRVGEQQTMFYTVQLVLYNVIGQGTSSDNSLSQSERAVVLTGLSH